MPFWDKPPPPPPPPPSLLDDLQLALEDPAMMAAAACVMLPLAFLLFRAVFPRRIVAHCELSEGGKPGDGSPRFVVSPHKQPSKTHLDRAKSGTFVPERAFKVSGTATLTARRGVCTIEYTVRGLEPGKHGFQIHEYADFSHGYISAGGIYNPFNKTHGGPTDPERKVGDLGNITADSTGVAKGRIMSSLVRLSGKSSVLGRSLMVHANADDLGKGDNSQPGPVPKMQPGKCSLVTGNVGAGLACGEIKLA